MEEKLLVSTLPSNPSFTGACSMTISKSTLLVATAAVIAITASEFIAPTPALADTFAIFNLGTDNGYSIYGIDTSGTVVIESFQPAPGLGDILYQTYLDGALISSARTIPNLNYDNGTPCTPTVSAPVTWSSGIGQTRCNNGHEVYFGTFPPFGRGIFTGPDITDLLPGPGTLDQVAMNASGDFVWADGRDELFFEAIDLTTAPTPEPGSILLVGTGALAAAAAMRRRFLQ
jgi:hypothetical protein